ncbi:hypothetical protein D6D17_10199 [Aureobasidium pullulans]|nr:hypothetical protein D6D17_10199 [Aureobasidium pullulans]
MFSHRLSHWDTPADEGAWGDAAAQPTIAVTSEVNLDAADAANFTADDDSIVELAPPTAEARKITLADLTNGDREAVTAHLAMGLGPHKLLSRFAGDKSAPTSSTEPNVTASLDESDGAASDVDTASSSSAASLLSTTEPAPPRQLQVMAQEFPLPESPAPVTPVVTIEPAIVNDDSHSSPIIVVKPDTYQEDLHSMSQSELDNLVDSDGAEHTEAGAVPCDECGWHCTCSEREALNSCDPVPQYWSVPTTMRDISDGDFFDRSVLGSIHQNLLNHYSQYFVKITSARAVVDWNEHEEILGSTSWAFFRRWIYTHKLSRNVEMISNGVVHIVEIGFDFQTLVKVWRLAARIQAPVFANNVADAMISKPITEKELQAAQKDINEMSSMVDADHIFCRLIARVVGINNITLDHKDWAKSLISATLMYEMGELSLDDTNSSSNIDACAYHMHQRGHICNF